MFKPFYFKKSEFTLQEIALHAIPRRLKWIDFVTERRWSYTVLDEDDRSVPVSKETWMCKAHNITSIEGSHRTVNCSSTFPVSSSAIASISYSVFGMVLLMLFLLCLCSSSRGSCILSFLSPFYLIYPFTSSQSDSFPQVANRGCQQT